MDAKICKCDCSCFFTTMPMFVEYSGNWNFTEIKCWYECKIRSLVWKQIVFSFRHRVRLLVNFGFQSDENWIKVLQTLKFSERLVRSHSKARGKSTKSSFSAFRVSPPERNVIAQIYDSPSLMSFFIDSAVTFLERIGLEEKADTTLNFNYGQHQTHL